MKSASELVEEARTRHKIEKIETNPVKKTPKEENWEKCKKYIQDLPANYIQILQEGLMEGLESKTSK
ncbi:MAG: hypothetical protein AABY22_27210, partial [Nanoarchaeota archaeon]